MYRIKTYRIMTLVSRYASYRKVGISLQPYLNCKTSVSVDFVNDLESTNLKQ
jgi:hypothetical protein